METLYEKEREKLLARALKSGEWLGKCLTVKLQQADIITTVENVFSRIMRPFMISLSRKKTEYRVKIHITFFKSRENRSCIKVPDWNVRCIWFTPNEQLLPGFNINSLHEHAKHTFTTLRTKQGIIAL